MGNYFDFQSRHSDQVSLSIHPSADFKEVLQTLESIRFPDFAANVENIKFAVLELISNSLRAHREKKVDKQVSVLFRARDSQVEVEVKDFGGGFDPAALPFKLDAEADSIDQSSPEFENYRREHNYLRFGLGLLVNKKTFPRFELIFIDADEKPIAWGGGPVQGTLIRASTRR